MELPEITDVERLVIHPWEALLVHVAGRIGHERAHALHDAVAAVLPKGVRVLIVEEGISFEVVTAPESVLEL
jgi:hypothetical protein